MLTSCQCQSFMFWLSMEYLLSDPSLRVFVLGVWYPRARRQNSRMTPRVENVISGFKVLTSIHILDVERRVGPLLYCHLSQVTKYCEINIPTVDEAIGLTTYVSARCHYQQYTCVRCKK